MSTKPQPQQKTPFRVKVTDRILRVLVKLRLLKKVGAQKTE